MSTKLWCPDCTTQTVVDVMSIADGFEFTCDDCGQVFFVRIERGLTPRAADLAVCTCEFPYSDLTNICSRCGKPIPPTANARRWAD